MTNAIDRRTKKVGASFLVLAIMMSAPAMAQDNSVSVTNNDGMTKKLIESADGSKLLLQDTRGVSTIFQYNNHGQLQSEDAPERGVTSYKYDEQGRPFRLEMEGGISSKLAFDEHNRITRQVWRKGSDQQVVRNYKYDGCINGLSKLCEVSHNDHTMRYGYTQDGKLAFTKSKISDENAVETIKYNYGREGLLKSARYPSGLLVSYSYDGQGRITGLSGVYKTGDDRRRFKILRAVRYDEETGNIVGFTHGNGIKTRYIYDASGQLEKITQRLKGELINRDTYGYNADGLIESIDRMNNSNNRRYNYDLDGRLVKEFHGNGTPSSLTTIGYNYDSVGNRLGRTIDGQTEHHNYAPNANQLQAIGQRNFSYDVRGNLIEDGSGPRSFSYDVTNRMNAFYRNGKLRAEYDYDANGRRIRKRLHRANIEGVKSVRFLYNTDGHLISEISRRNDRSKVKARDIVWLGPIAIAQIERVLKPNGMTKKAKVLSIHTDYLGSPRFATDNEGTTVWSWYGDAFGSNIGATPAVNRDPDGDGKKTEVPLRFLGQYHDRESGLWYNHHRDYDPKLGRYIQSDPIGLAGGVNRYTYVSAKPTYLIDPNGLAEICFSLSTGYTPGSSGQQGRNPSEVPAGVVATGTRNSQRPKRMCLNIPDTQPIIPIIPIAPPVPQPIAPTLPPPAPPPGPKKKKKKEECTDEDDALADAVRDAFRNPNSNVREHGGLLVKMPDGSITTVAAPPGAPFAPGTSPTVDIFGAVVPPGATVLGGFHTHPNTPVLGSDGRIYTPHQYFSPNDFMIASPGSSGAWLRTPGGSVYGSIPNSYIPDWGGIALGTNISSNVQIFTLANGAYTGQVPPGFAGQRLQEFMANHAVEITVCGSNP